MIVKAAGRLLTRIRSKREGEDAPPISSPSTWTINGLAEEITKDGD
jgi:hypothetical protein